MSSTSYYRQSLQQKLTNDSQLRDRIDDILTTNARKPEDFEIAIQALDFLCIDVITFLSLVDIPLARIDRLHERMEALGSTSSFLLRHLKPSDFVDRFTLRDDAKHLKYLENRDTVRAVAYSIMIMEFPMQLKPSTNTVLTVLDAVVDTRWIDKLPNHSDIQIDSAAWRKTTFPTKKHVGATNKANVFLSEIMRDLEAFNKATWRFFIGYGVPKMASHSLMSEDRLSDDQVCAIVMATVALTEVLGNSLRAFKIAFTIADDIDTANKLTTVLKSLGQNGCRTGAMLVEGKCLKGRGLPSKMATDWKYRTNRTQALSKTHKKVDPDKLRTAIRYVYEKELPRTAVDRVVYENFDDWWETRVQWCVNGSHSNRFSRIYKHLKVDSAVLKAEKATIFRKVFVEHCQKEPVSDWPGISYYSPSDKLEAGASRAIYSCDTLTYLAFEHLLKPVERCWKNEKVILDPGNDGTYGMNRRIRRLRSSGGRFDVNIMLDYDDFNSCHTNEFMSIVIDELVKHVSYAEQMYAHGYDGELLCRRLVESLYRGRMFVPNSRNPDNPETKQVYATLMSGHRATTFINSVLNYAYIEVAYPGVRNMMSMHVGDDVIVLCRTYEDAYALLRSCKMLELNMNPIKQSVGEYVAEFLRVAHVDMICYGYMMRSIGSCVCGNWVNEIRLNYEEGLRTIINHGWTLHNRSHTQFVPLLLVSSMVRMARVSRGNACNLLTGSTGLEPGFQRSRRVGATTLKLKYKQDDRESQWLTDKVSQCKSLATDDYLSTRVSDLEREVLEAEGISPKNELMLSSYKKSFAGSQPYSKFLDAAPKLVRYQHKFKGHIDLDEAWDARDKLPKGLLTEYPMLVLVRNRIRRSTVRVLLFEMTGNLYYGKQLDEVAWGEREGGTLCSCPLSYSDAGSLAGVCQWKTVYSSFRAYV
ncbi:hypothetical protein 2 [Beihai victori-like virus 1]|uniref:hypothetical protein 2 n=1 Tax=Beihai victori-like virus 1 TaxID=1922737 RepID=UPI000909C45D|nr:hypothetical protein 2 [Beihai victori-like virus 1]APG75993.1 hypothetical protein 2 [Beihai victori-like virus 1]